MVFPKNFIWGTSAATHQFEENNTNNNWYEWKKFFLTRLFDDKEFEKMIEKIKEII
jgi:beta-glucosidase/6-phospho-beta-glucosidase/beta-galactosidase